MADIAEDIIDALRLVYDPCCQAKGISVVDMGLVRSVDVDGESARVELVLTSGWCPFSVDLLRTVRQKVTELGIEDPVVEVRWDEAWSPERMAPEARRKLMFLPEPRFVKHREDFIAEGGRRP